ncbi:YggS family pyridoxal phosphate-dependent enzyme [Neisseria animalis]|uniref:Pyridoxal phosphate homeostasis protein n=1 Tax=Neisseria animalis TaxID=492 RepID=A0A5P3MQM9_NEIAN|nr:YggS family pyridoxal phosphate-dependent enzyme [Neisseria animalis]QEY23884.1 YggS family pyridoxal phosphate-dependent enzyme [Neisseria animalis]ROW32048.1 YggS family pyridoxal phosphate-dependent enzyme [Neisseria animalis]VEE05784.1 Predicted enzyme with a TIM-barrel fold [Neisseria animalis]
MSVLKRNYQTVCAAVRQAEAAAGREEDSVRLIAVSKTFPAEDIREVYAAGQRDFGENYIQEWYGKTEALADLPDIVWHVIGDVQSNKTKFVAERAHWLHTVSRLKTAQRISAQRPSAMPPLQVCIEVNIAAESAKHGVVPEEAVGLAKEVAKLPNIQVRGLMCVAAAEVGEAELARQFGRMKSLLADLNAAGIEADVLSMGMSADMSTAVRCGATHVRIGSAIFGNRTYGEPSETA